MNTEEFNKFLITFLANENCLWNPNDVSYNSINERHNAYTRIGLQLRDFGASDSQVNRVNDRFQALKRRFISEYRKVQSGKQSTWMHYSQLEGLLGAFVDKPKEPIHNVQTINSEPSCSNNEALSPNISLSESRKRKQMNEEEKLINKKRSEFSGIFEYMTIKLQEMDDQTQKGVIEKLLRVVHNPSIRLLDEQQLQPVIPTAPQWTVPADQY